ncbi:MAG TPA: CAP domain-containing protein [Chloroflexia bacterium]|nr:CAP domain-containing protein [Chloroflexia bacterium]
MQAHDKHAQEWAPRTDAAGASVDLTSRTQQGLGRLLGAIALAVALVAQMPGDTSLDTSALPSTGAPARSQFFAPTGKTVQGDFLDTFNRFGLARVGYPLSDERMENGTRVQYFERVRMEFHPETAPAGRPVMFSRLGAEMAGPVASATVKPFASTRTRAYFAETRHSLAEPFLSYWKQNGGVELFGYPITEAVMQDGLKVQWFERARMEYHPELAKKGQAVQLSLLGKVALEKVAAPAQVPAAQETGKGPDKQPAPPAEKQAAAPSLAEAETFLLNAINEQRTAAGMSPVALDGATVELARDRSRDMAARNYFSHSTPEGEKFLGMMTQRGIGYKYAGEILARNNYPDAQAPGTAMTTYLNSAPHKAILMDGRYNLVGVGYARSDEDSMHYFTVIFVQR